MKIKITIKIGVNVGDNGTDYLDLEAKCTSPYRSLALAPIYVTGRTTPTQVRAYVGRGRFARASNKGDPIWITSVGLGLPSGSVGVGSATDAPSSSSLLDESWPSLVDSLAAKPVGKFQRRKRYEESFLRTSRTGCEFDSLRYRLSQFLSNFEFAYLLFL